ncbi:MAG: methylmalonyl-CoA mutase small subunit [Bacteroidales bacterium]|nr:methylmalonyl-CoA mutase small subunit [Bacteroidales bacterium]NLH23664.1 methylmalonyl-CoA mutase small subunit [Bacteroidales bacterium]
MTDKLFKEFPPVPTQQWEEQIRLDLKGADYEKKLVWKTTDGFRVRPYYREEDLKGIPNLDSLPGQKPYLRGTRPDNAWLIRQGFSLKDSLSRVNARVLEALDRGVESVGFVLEQEQELTYQEMKTLLKGVFLPAIEVAFEGVSCKKTGTLHAFLEHVRITGTPPDQVRARFGFDPAGDAFFAGSMPQTEDFEVLTGLIETCRDYPRVRLVGIPGSRIQNQGSGVVLELAFAIAMGYEYIRILTSRGLSPEIAARSIHFHMGIGTHYFLEMAKFRAARVFWDEISNSKIAVHATSGTWSQTAYDMYVNLLRGTTQAMSAALAGVDSLEVLPFDGVVAGGSEQGYRLARNIQIILREEACFDQVTDPAAGSYYIENLTDSVLNESRKVYREILKTGGFSDPHTCDRFRETVKSTRERRLQNLAQRREILVGINQYPDARGKAPAGLTLSGEEEWMRAATGFEMMRLRTEKAPETPAVFLLTFGNLAMCRARAQFSANFFGIAGFRILDNNRFATVEEGIQAARKSGARIVVACSSDDEYEQTVPLIARSLDPGTILTVAGDPPCKEALMKEGIDHFISIRSNVLETLLGYQKELGL